jgi:hypothetical protein
MKFEYRKPTITTNGKSSRALNDMALGVYIQVIVVMSFVTALIS